MDKISGILPANARVTTVDLRNSGVARSGSPSFGRSVGMSSAERQQKDAMINASQLREEQANMRSAAKQDPRAEIVQRMADNFFVTKAKQYEEEREAVPRSEIDEVAEVTQFSPKALNTSSAADESADSSSVNSDEDSAVVGQHLDVMA